MTNIYMKTLIKSLVLSLCAVIFAVTAFAGSASAQYYDTGYYYVQPTYTYPETSYTYPGYSYSYPTSYYPYNYQYPQYQFPQYNYPTYDYPYYNQYQAHPLYVSCRANVNSSVPGQFVSWYAYASGGNGYYTYDWSGENVPNNNSSSISVPYYAPGTKAPVVTVTSGNRTVRKACDSITVITQYSVRPNWWWGW